MQTVMTFKKMILSCLLVPIILGLQITATEFKCDFDICNTDDFQYCDWEDKRCGICDCDAQSVIPQCEEICKKKNVCNSNPCENSGICTVNNQDTTGYTCTCSAGFTGPTCNAPINDACTDNPCLNNGVCQVSGTSFECSCAAGYSGTTCQIYESACSPNPCQNDGNCFLNNDGYICKCPDGYSGTNCKTGSGPENKYIAGIVTVIFVLAVISIGILVLYLYKKKLFCFSYDLAASIANSLLNVFGGLFQSKSQIDNEKKLPIPEEGEPFIEHHHASPTADINSDQHQKVYNPSGINYEIIDESDIKEQTNIKQV